MSRAAACYWIKVGSWKCFFLSILCAAGVWVYAQRVLIPYQIADAAAHNRPRGNLSDLYPRWLGARELLLHGRDPYSAEVTREIQAGYYGRPLDSSRHDDPGDQAGFAYPVYVVFCLAPTVRLPFSIVQKVFFWLSLVLTAVSALVWLRVLRGPVVFTREIFDSFRAVGRGPQGPKPAFSQALNGTAKAVPYPKPIHETRSAQIIVLILTLGSLPVMQGLKLEQISLLVAGLVALAIWLLIKDHPIPAGIVLAFATIKPQLVLLVVVWLGIWTLADLRRRYLWLAAFLATMGILFAAPEWYLPHWIPRFWQALHEYQAYTGAMGIMEKLLGPLLGRILEVLALAATLSVCWRERRAAENTRAFAYTVSLVLASTVLLVPTLAVYNQVLLIPALLVLLDERRTIWQGSVVNRLLFVLTAVLVFWPWIASVVLASLSFVSPRETVERGWPVPFWTTLFIPVGVAGMMLVVAWERTFAASADVSTS